LLLIALLSFADPVNKRGRFKPYSFVPAKFIGNEVYIFIETTGGGWGKNQKIAMLMNEKIYC
jgi:hypothetical protein